MFHGSLGLLNRVFLQVEDCDARLAVTRQPSHHNWMTFASNVKPITFIRTHSETVLLEAICEVSPAKVSFR
jgi:hypothetical protein